jgi:hypothetical protein
LPIYGEPKGSASLSDSDAIIQYAAQRLALPAKQASLPFRFFWIKGYSLTASTNRKNSLKGNIKQESITPQAVKAYGTLIGNPELAAHDLRRTFER